MKHEIAHRCCVCNTVTTGEPKQWLAVNVTVNPAFTDAGPQSNDPEHDLVCGAFCAVRLASEVVNRVLGVNPIAETANMLGCLLEEPPCDYRGVPQYDPQAEALLVKLEGRDVSE